MTRLIKKYQQGLYFPQNGQWSHADSLYVQKAKEAFNQRQLERQQEVERNKQIVNKTMPFNFGAAAIGVLWNSLQNIWRNETGKSKSSQLYKEAEELKKQTQWAPKQNKKKK